MKSHRLLKRVFKDSSVPIIANEMHLSPSTVYKWAEAPDTGSASGIPNPLDRALSLYNATDDLKGEQDWEKNEGYFGPIMKKAFELKERHYGSLTSLNIFSAVSLSIL